ncbi:hypothetical protein SI65_02244 [Aspergillus cristatus]|uniref:C2H2-type domain-containing protein n=1 Tax=Aspergillus cristatus TaxID=573508 RepID=A0A1E3BKS3_ASPCR|nr:hypothetical protein SI65_02244 [Aspergillus cristatus]
MPTFMIGIGRHNAMFLRSVQWKEWVGICHEWIDMLRPFLMSVPAVDQQSEQSLNSNDAVSEGIWTNEGAFQAFLEVIDTTIYKEGYPAFGKRLVRFGNAGDPVADDIRVRHKLYSRLDTIWKYVNKTGLRNHLGWYTGDWRIPADGIHDVLSIDQILNPPDPDRQNQYRCPSCAKIIDSRRNFMEHVWYRRHYGPYGDGSGNGDGGGEGDSGTTTTKATGKRKRGYLETWILPFVEELVKVHQRKGPFAFLCLPFDIRQIIYKELLQYTLIIIHQPTRPSTTGRQRDGVWLQHNLHRNALAMLAVSRQTYEEGRRVFYGLNTFLFETVNMGERVGEWQDWIEVLRPFLVPVAEGSDDGGDDDEDEAGEEEEGNGDDDDDEEEEEETPEPTEPTIWTDEDTYLDLLKLLAAKPPTGMYQMYNSDRDRLLRFEDAGNYISGDIRERHSMSVTLRRNTNAGSIRKKGVVSFELLERKSKESRLPRDVRTSYEYYQTRRKEEMTSGSNDNDG